MGRSWLNGPEYTNAEVLEGVRILQRNMHPTSLEEAEGADMTSDKIGFTVKSGPMTSLGSKGATFIGHGSDRDVSAYLSGPGDNSVIPPSVVRAEVVTEYLMTCPQHGRVKGIPTEEAARFLADDHNRRFHATREGEPS